MPPQLACLEEVQLIFPTVRVAGHADAFSLCAKVSDSVLVLQRLSLDNPCLQFNVPYPALYAPAGHKNAKEFDCIQRGMQK